MLMFVLDRVFLTEFLRVSYTCSSDYSVYDGECTYTHLLHAHFSAHSACTTTFAHLHACAHTRMAQVHEKGVCRMSVFVLYLAFSLLMSHPSFAVSLRLSLSLSLDFPVNTFLPVPNCPQKHRTPHSAHASRSLATWPSQMQTHHRHLFQVLAVC